ncbi:peptide chain release factor N(5)-glutamine methyltransferase [Rhodohalobacter sp.]|uniref:peptide chain release factor N(5)-glutamine methyltransferase n=1 Tax=Rhodohalobacter sp. TaxID=1974210 RepID=UPI003564A770
MSSNSEKVWTVLSMLEWATDFFEEKSVQNPRLSIEWLLADVLNINRLDLYLKFDRPLSTTELDQLRPLVKRRSLHEPLQHLTGSTDFLNCTIHIDKNVLIPRTETEQLAELVLNQHSNSDHLNVLDIGTGSGCIPIAIKKARPNWKCTGVDISPEALKISSHNAELNEVEVTFLEADMNTLAKNKNIMNQDWDIIISNPPYITPTEKSEMDPQVLNFEPNLALFHDDPISLYRKICEFASLCEAKLFLECNDKFATKIKEAAISFYHDAELIQDYDENDRFVIAQNPAK